MKPPAQSQPTIDDQAVAQVILTPVIDWTAFAAVLFDLDGVVTDTARIHARAWKQLFDDFLQQHAESTGAPFKTFDIVQDYARYVDGKPRLDGIHSFLRARGISIPQGTKEDSPNEPTIMGLAHRKNNLFLDHIRARGVVVHPGAVRLIKALRHLPCHLAIVSSSRNCRTILESAGLAGFFDAHIDGITADDKQFRGKPAPDLFLEAARRLDVAPQHAVVIEDAVAGIEAASAGQFGLVIGVDRVGDPERLRLAGAHYVVNNLDDLTQPSAAPSLAGALPSALVEFSILAARLAGKKIAVFLDYDGTLTPIVARPELAVLDGAMRATLRQLATACPVIVISGRERSDVARLVDIDMITYAGSHGFDISGPRGAKNQNTPADGFVPAVHRAAEMLKADLCTVQGILVEDKTYTVAIHYRLVSPELLGAVEKAVDAALQSEPSLRKMGGKKVFELRPNIPWDKGKAALWILDALGLTGPEVVPIYIGDDVTDYDAFAALKSIGIGILVGDAPHPICAHYHLNDPAEVEAFLRRLSQLLGGGAP